MPNEICKFCGRKVDDHYDYRFDAEGNSIGDGYTPCLEGVLGGVAVSEWFRQKYEE